MSIPNFAGLDLGTPRRATGTPGRKAVQEATGKGPDALAWETPEGIGVKPVYTADDLPSWTS